MVPSHFQGTSHLSISKKYSPPTIFSGRMSFIHLQTTQLLGNFIGKKHHLILGYPAAASSNQASVLFSMSSSSNTRDSHTEKNDVLPVGTSHFSIWNYNPALFRANQNGQDFFHPSSANKKKSCQFCLE